ncbi:hypothetical protein PR048_010013 [Dryococelus australis]|uniref:DDE-1 domain-containing protein n=1 Tax=Dryococelus australis TaxID=614101 RepID=A0ABQ9I1I0_9NEOP|nr:hypothetical protein PR048_010013 [Dryococelus australis]
MVARTNYQKLTGSTLYAIQVKTRLDKAVQLELLEGLEDVEVDKDPAHRVVERAVKSSTGSEKGRSAESSSTRSGRASCRSSLALKRVGEHPVFSGREPVYTLPAHHLLGCGDVGGSSNGCWSKVGGAIPLCALELLDLEARSWPLGWWLILASGRVGVASDSRANRITASSETLVCLQVSEPAAHKFHTLPRDPRPTVWSVRLAASHVSKPHLGQKLKYENRKQWIERNLQTNLHSQSNKGSVLLTFPYYKPVTAGGYKKYDADKVKKAVVNLEGGMSIRTTAENMEYISVFSTGTGKKVMASNQEMGKPLSQLKKNVNNAFFNELEKELARVPPSNIIIMMKYPEQIMNSCKSSMSAMFATAGNGVILPPYVVYRTQHLYQNWTEEGPTDARYNQAKSGLFDCYCFEDWVQTIATLYLRRLDDKKLLIGDNLSSHLSLEDFEEKITYHSYFFLWKKGPGRNESTIPKDKFPGLLKKLFHSLKEENVVADFKKCGIAPVSRNKVLQMFLSINTTDLNKSSNEQRNC